MSQWRKIAAVCLCALIFMLTMTSSANADPADTRPTTATVNEYNTPNTGDVFPKEELDAKSRSLFKRYGLATFQLDYVQTFKSKEEQAAEVVQDCKPEFSFTGVLKAVTGLKSFQCTASAATNVFGKTVGKYFDINYYINILNTILWINYLKTAFFVTSWISWAFSLEIINIVIDSYNKAMENIQKTVWDPLMYFMWAVAVAWMVYFWIVGKTTQLWSSFLNAILVIALSATLFANMGTFLQTMTRASTIISVTILNGVTGQNQNAEINSAPEEDQQKIVLNALQENLYGIFIDLPYLLIDVGSPELASKIPFEDVLKAGFDDDKRADVLVKAYNKMNDEDKKKMLWLTPVKTMDRLVNSCIIMFLAQLGMLCFAYIAVLALIWQFIAMGRGLVFAYYLIMSLWPHYGLEPAAMQLWKIAQALCMKFILVSFLGTETVIVYSFATSDQIQKAGLLNTWVIIILLTIGFYIAMNEVTRKLQNVPLGNGVFAQAYSTEAQGVLQKAYSIAEKGAGYAIAGVSAAYGSPGGVKAGLAIARKGATGAAELGTREGLEKLANIRSDQREEKKERKDADRAYQDRKEGLNEADASFADQVRRDYGVDVTTAEGRDQLEQINPELAKQRQAELYRIRDNSMANAMARRMPANIPAEGTPEYQALVQQFGEENVKNWKSAQLDEQAKVDKAMENYKKLSKVEQMSTPKPKVQTKNVRARFEAIQSANRVKLESEMNRIAQQAANSSNMVMDLQFLGTDSQGVLKDINQSLDVRVDRNVSPAQMSQFQEKLRREVQKLGGVSGKANIKVNMPKLNGSGDETWNVTVGELNQAQQAIHQQFNDATLAMKINEILEKRRGGNVSQDELRKTIDQMRSELTKNLAGSAKAPTVFESITGTRGIDMNQAIDMLGPMLGIDFKDLYTYKDRMEKISKRLRDVERKQQQQQNPPNTPPRGRP